MANRFVNPDEQFADSTGAALSGGQLFFYATGTSTKQNTYSDSSLTTPNTNPVVLDSSGRSGSIFLQNLRYKIVLAPATDTDPPTSPIWTMDPVYTSDVSTIAQVQGVNGNPNGQLAGTQGSATVPASVAWDFTNQILYVCTTTGNAAGAVWTAVNPNTTSAVIPSPQGRLTPTSNTPVINSDATAATTVYYTPYNGLLVPIYNGTIFVPTSIVSQLSMGLVAAHVAVNIYDFYIFSLSGVPTLGTGPSWAAGSGGSITGGSCARGTGAGGAALSRLGGIYTNAVSMTMTYGPSGSTTTVGANKGTYVGTMYVDGTNGQVTCHVTWGQNRKFGIWNAYNRVSMVLQAGDSTANWVYATASWRASHGSSNNNLITLDGLAEENQIITFDQAVQNDITNLIPQVQIGIGQNETTSPVGYYANIGVYGNATPVQFFGSGHANFSIPPALGINVFYSLENSTSAVNTLFYGTSSQMLLEAQWRG